MVDGLSLSSSENTRMAGLPFTGRAYVGIAEWDSDSPVVDSGPSPEVDGPDMLQGDTQSRRRPWNGMSRCVCAGTLACPLFWSGCAG